MKINTLFYSLMTNLPFAILPNDIIYMESEFNEDVNRYIQMYYDEICANMKSHGRRFIYFPRLDEDLLEDIIRNQYPEYADLSSDMISLKSNFMIQFLPEDERHYYYGPTFICYSCSRFDPNTEKHTKESEYDIALYAIEDYETIFADEDLSRLLYSIESEMEEQLYVEENQIDFDDNWDVEYIDEDEKDIEGAEAEIDNIVKTSRSNKTKALIEEIKEKINELNGIDKDSTVFRYHLRREMFPFLHVSDVVVTKRCEIQLVDLDISLKLSVFIL